MIWFQVIVAITTVLVGVLWFRLHPLLVLLAAGLLVAVTTPTAGLEQFAVTEVEKGNWTAKTAERFVSSNPAARLASAFGTTAGDVGILIAMASIVGICLLESGAAKVIVDRILSLVGPRGAAEALMASSFVLGIPVYFDTVFYLMVPLARSLQRTLGRDYVLFIMAILAGGSLAHSLVPPTPGPLQVAATMQIDVATLMLTGLAVCACSSLLSMLAARLINRLVDVPLRPLTDFDNASDGPAGAEGPVESLRLNQTGPPLLLSLLPIILPVVLIGLGTAYNMLDQRPEITPTDRGIALLTDKNVALGLAAVVALTLLRYGPAGEPADGQQARRSRVIQQALASGGTIILITAAGGAFGAMLRQAGIAAVISQLVTGTSSVMLLVVAFFVTAAIRTLQGSATVSMITSAALFQDIATGNELTFHPVYLALAVGAGSKPIAWMTDSGFWVMCKMSGMTEAEGLRTVSPMTTAMGFAALLVTVLGAVLFPMRG